MIVHACELSEDLDNGDDNDDSGDGVATGLSVSGVFPELDRLAESDPVLLRPLIPFCSLARRAHDPFRRVERVESVVSTFHRAGQAAAGWVQPSDILLSRCSFAWRKLVAQHDRLVRILGDDRRRAGWVDDIFDIATKVAEGPFRLYGGIILIADRIANGLESSLDADTSSRHRNFPLVLRGLTQVAPVLAEGVDGLVRNAEAHYDYTVEGDRIIVHHQPPRDGSPPRTDELLFEDLLTAVLNLFELSLAMAIGMLKWIWDNGAIDLKERHRQDWLAT